MTRFSGFYPVHFCKQCSAVLGGTNHGTADDPSYDRPAELYMGTYTGLCYSCQNAEVTIIEVYPDSAKLKEYPPHCPSWRRDRERYTAFDDCAECGGKGFKWVVRADALGGSYPVHCEACNRRHNAKEYARRDREEARDKLIARAREIEAETRSKAYKGVTPEALQDMPIAVEYRQIVRQLWT